MNKFGKIIALALLCLLTLSCLTACGENPVQQTETEVVITVEKSILSSVEGKTLEDYLKTLAEKEKLTYEVENGMVMKINDKFADASQNQYWLIYTDDAENSNKAWGTYEYDGKTFNSCLYGIAQMPLKADATYVFVISKF